MHQLRSISCLLFLILGLLACDKKSVEIVPIIERYDIKVMDDVVIYDNSMHSAFTCLQKYKNELYLAFREGTSHRPLIKNEYGKIRILKFQNNHWESIAVLYDIDKDLRDPYLLVKDDKLVVYCGYNQIKGDEYSHSGTAYCVLGENGNTFSDIINDAPHVVWLWKIREYKGEYYGIAYLETEKPRLMKSVDGFSWKTISIIPLNNCSEADLLFKADSLFMCIRQEGAGNPSYWGKSCYPFVKTDWIEMDVSIASPELYSLTDSQILLAGREYSFGKKNKPDSINVSLFTLNTLGEAKRLNVFDTGRLGDKGYPSFCLLGNDNMGMSYYLGTSDKSVIKLASIKLEPLYNR